MRAIAWVFVACLLVLALAFDVKEEMLFWAGFVACCLGLHVLYGVDAVLEWRASKKGEQL